TAGRSAATSGAARPRSPRPCSSSRTSSPLADPLNLLARTKEHDLARPSSLGHRDDRVVASLEELPRERLALDLELPRERGLPARLVVATALRPTQHERI